MKLLLGAAHAPLTLRRLATLLALLTVLLVLAVVVSLSVGSVPLTPVEVLRALVPGGVSDAARAIVVDIRLPRVLLAAVVGIGLSIAGVALQALLRNPLAEPYILGISSGGTVGAILAFSLALGPLVTPFVSFAGSALVMLVVYGVAHRRGTLDSYTLLLAGVMIGAFFNALVLLVVAIFNQELRSSFLWLMGNLSGANPESLGIVSPLVLLGAAVLMVDARRFNLVALGDETALELGVDVRSVKRRAYITASFITGVVVSVSGVVGFVGLLIPHVCRLLFGPDHRLLLPASALMGAIFLVAADTVARLVLAPAEIPVGAVTAAIGAPLFVYLLRTR
jgi:iron complex transport system permease protein